MALPKVTIILYAYNEQQFIKEAVRSILNQRYNDLEVVLSDDGSTDDTYESMKEVVATYAGPHEIVFNRNEINVGIGGQLNKCVQKSKGELIILANGDDVSLPDRVSETVDAWLKSGNSVHAIHSDLENIDEQGNKLGSYIRTNRGYGTLENGVRCRFGGVAAASLALSRDVFERFGPLPDNLILEDNPLFMRAFILGGGKTLHLEKPLVRYRIHKANISQSYASGEFDEWVERNRKRIIWHKREGVKAYLQMLRDLHSVAVEDWPDVDLKKARWEGMVKVLENQIQLDYYTHDNAITSAIRWKGLIKLAMLLLKTEIKTRLPIIERRNARWHYKRTQGKKKVDG